MKMSEPKRQAEIKPSSRSNRTKEENSSFFGSKNSVGEPFFKPTIVQASLKMGEKDDPFEREADLIAGKVVSEPDTEVQMKSGDQPVVKNRTDSARNGVQVPYDISREITANSGKGHSLPGETQKEMETKIGADFSSVSIHTGPDAARLSDNLGARAFTAGNDIYFNRGEYQPGTTEGRKLMAHELVHTVQQGGGNLTDGMIRRQGFSIQGEGYSMDIPDGMRSIDIGGGPERLDEFDMQYLAVRVMHSDATIIYFIDLSRQIGFAINSLNQDELVDAWRRIGKWLHYERDVPDRFISGHLYPKIISAEEFILLAEYELWNSGFHEGEIENEEIIPVSNRWMARVNFSASLGVGTIFEIEIVDTENDLFMRYGFAGAGISWGAGAGGESEWRNFRTNWEVSIKNWEGIATVLSVQAQSMKGPSFMRLNIFANSERGRVTGTMDFRSLSGEGLGLGGGIGWGRLFSDSSTGPWPKSYNG